MELVSHASCFSTAMSVTLSPEFLRSSRLSFCCLSSLQLSARFPSPKGFCGSENECLTRRMRRRSGVSASSSSRRKAGEVNGVFEQNISVRLKKEGYHGNGVKWGAWRSSSTAIQVLDVRQHDKGGSLLDSDERLAEPKTFKDGIYFDSIVKVYNTHIEPDYFLPWQKQRQCTSSGSAFAIGDEKLLTNAHCVEHGTLLKVKKRGDDQKYIAKVLATGVDCDLALLSVENKEFWNGVEPLVLGELPQLQDSVTVVGYPTGGETISVTKGVVSRIEVTSYSHGETRLLTIQIDAAINPGNSGGPAFNSRGQCIGVAFQGLASESIENIGYLIPTTVVSHFLKDYERHGKYTGFPCLGVLLQWMENPALRSYLKLSNEGVLVRRVEPTSNSYGILKEGDVIASFNGTRLGWEGSVPFRNSERIEFGYLISQKFSGDAVELGVIRDGAFMKVQTTLGPRVHLVPLHIDIQPSYLIVLGFVFTPLSMPLVDEEDEDEIVRKLKAKAHYSLARFKGEQIVIVSQVLANERNIGYEDISNQQVVKFNGTEIKNIRHLAHLVDNCKDKYLVFEFEDKFLAVLERESAMSASSSILKDYGIPSERSADLLEPLVDILFENNTPEMDVGGSPVFNTDKLFWV